MRLRCRECGGQLTLGFRTTSMERLLVRHAEFLQKKSAATRTFKKLAEDRERRQQVQVLLPAP